jgi:hypothetical protein
MERMMVAFGLSSPPAILDLNGTALRSQFDTDPGWFLEKMEDQFAERDMQGIHVWEGVPCVSEPYEDEFGSHDGTCDLQQGSWREPTDAEWVALRAGRSPFNTPAQPLGTLVE